MIIGNWKMHKSQEEAASFISELIPLIKGASSHVGIAAPYTSIQSAAAASEGSPIEIGAQNMSEHREGAYTGEISSMMLKSVGASFVLIGHSERRHIFKEDEEMIRCKLKWAIREGIFPILCVGETEDERDGGETKTVLERQIGSVLEGLQEEDLRQIVIAYEPVWAIGTGKAATPEMAEDAHVMCRQFLAVKWGEFVADSVPILYGGSVKPENTKELLGQPNISGALVGGASLKAETFAQIINFSKELNTL